MLRCCQRCWARVLAARGAAAAAASDAKPEARVETHRPVWVLGGAALTQAVESAPRGMQVLLLPWTALLKRSKQPGGCCMGCDGR